MPHTHTPTIALIISLERLGKQGGCSDSIQGKNWEKYTKLSGEDVWKVLVGTRNLCDGMKATPEMIQDVRIIRKSLQKVQTEIRVHY